MPISGHHAGKSVLLYLQASNWGKQYGCAGRSPVTRVMDQLPVQQQVTVAPVASFHARPYIYIKRVLDVAGSLLLLLLLSPLFLLIALATTLESPGGVFFQQPR